MVKRKLDLFAVLAVLEIYKIVEMLENHRKEMKAVEWIFSLKEIDLLLKILLNYEAVKLIAVSCGKIKNYVTRIELRWWFGYYVNRLI